MAFGHSEGPEVDYSMYMLMGNEAGSWVFMTATTQLMHEALRILIVMVTPAHGWYQCESSCPLVSCFPENECFLVLLSANTDATIELLVELCRTPAVVEALRHCCFCHRYWQYW